MAEGKENNPILAYLKAIDAMRKIDEVCGTDWDGDEEIFRENDEVRDLYKTYLEYMRVFRKGFKPDLVLGGAKEDVAEAISELCEVREVGSGARAYIEIAKTAAECFDNQEAVDIYDGLLSLEYFNPDDWLERFSKREMGPLLVKGAGIPTWLHKRYTEAVYAYVYGFFNASVALCRSIIEGVVKSKLEEKRVPIEGKSLDELLRISVRAAIAGEQAVWFGNFVRQMGNSVLHQAWINRNIDAKKAQRVITRTKEFIEHLY